MTLRIVHGVYRLWRLRSELAWVVAGQTMAFFGGFMAVKFLTGIMGPEGYGYFALGLTIAGAVQMFVFGPLGQSVTRFMSISGEIGGQTSYLVLAKQAHVQAGGFILLLACLASVTVALVVGTGWGALVGVASIFAIANGWNGTAIQFLNVLRLRRVAALHQGADVWVRAIAAIIGAAISQWFGVAAIIGYLFGAVFIGASLIGTIRRSEFMRAHWSTSMSWRQVDTNVRAHFFRYAGSFVLGAVPVAINTFADRWILQGMVGSREVGIYAALYQIANAPVVLLVSVVNQLAIPIIYERAGNMTTTAQYDSSRRALNMAIIVVAGLLLLIVIGAYVVSEPIVRLLTTGEFATHHQLLVPLVVAVGVTWIGNLKTIEAECSKIPHVVLWPKFVAAFLFVVLGIVMGGADGAHGVATALMITACVYATLVFVVLYMVNGKRG